MKRKHLLFLLSLFISFCSIAQSPILKGTLRDSVENKSLHNAVISVLRKSDTTLVNFTRADKSGQFSLAKIDTGNYLLLVTYPKFADYMEPLTVMNSTDLGNIFMNCQPGT